MKRQSRTCIAIIKNKSGKIVMAGDRRVSEHWGSAYKCPGPKIRKKKNGILIGASGDSGLCKLIVDVFQPPKIRVEDTDTYMFFQFQPELINILASQPGYVKDKKVLDLPPNTLCVALVCVNGRAYIVNISNVIEEGVHATPHGGVLIIDDAPIPYAIGCGGASAVPILISEKKKLGYSTKEHLKQAMEIAAEISPGCDNSVNFISE